MSLRQKSTEKLVRGEVVLHCFALQCLTHLFLARTRYSEYPTLATYYFMLNTGRMADFSFLKNNVSKKWVVKAPRRSKRPDVANGKLPICPFCNNHEKPVYKLGGTPETEEWDVKVIPNKFPFTDPHELVIHSPDHHKNFEKLPIPHIELILKAYRHRYNEHAHKGQVYIFHNRGKKAGESIPHPHTQITVVPDKVYLDLPLRRSIETDVAHGLATTHFMIVCPSTSQWPDEVWIAPTKAGEVFGMITDDAINDLSHILFSLVIIFDLRYQHDFPFNFYIYPDQNWYLRIIPRKKALGGFEVGSGVIVNTQDPAETMEFVRTHFHKPDIEKILKEHIADYHEHV